MGRPHASWLQLVDQHLKEMGMGQASAWWMARGPWSTGGKWTQQFLGCGKWTQLSFSHRILILNHCGVLNFLLKQNGLFNSW